MLWTKFEGTTELSLKQKDLSRDIHTICCYGYAVMLYVEVITLCVMKEYFYQRWFSHWYSLLSEEHLVKSKSLIYIYFYLSTLELKSTYVFMIKTEQTGNLSSIDNM